MGNIREIVLSQFYSGMQTVSSLEVEVACCVCDVFAYTWSLFQTEEWNVDRVCGWLESVAAVQNSGRPVHPDDLRAGERLSHSLTLSLCTSIWGTGGDVGDGGRLRCLHGKVDTTYM